MSPTYSERSMPPMICSGDGAVPALAGARHRGQPPQPPCCPQSLTMLPPTAASASVSLGEKPAPQSWREKMLGTRVCFTSESKKGSRLSSGWWERKQRQHEDVSVLPLPPWPGPPYPRDPACYWSRDHGHQHCCNLGPRGPSRAKGRGNWALPAVSRLLAGPGRADVLTHPGDLGVR